MKYTDILKFWFEELSTKQWWVKDPELDKTIKKRFLEVHQKANRCELYGWRKTPRGRLAEIIVLDQFSRNIFRGRPESFASDQLALSLSQAAIQAESDISLSNQEKSFLYMPYMHSESKVIHEEAVKLYSTDGLEFNLEFEYKHKKIIDRFNRYPHRNEILNRESTQEEIEFLKGPDSSF